MRALIVLVALLLTPALFAIANASPCDSDGQPALGVLEFPMIDGKILYGDDRNAALGNGFRLYEETNAWYVGDQPGSTGIDGHLQRGSTSGGPPLFELLLPMDPCVDPRPFGLDPDQDHTG